MRIIVDYVTCFLIVSVITSVSGSCSLSLLPYYDARCYAQELNGYYLLRPCPDGDYVNPRTCQLEAIPHDLQIHHSPKCAQALQNGGGVYITAAEVHQHGTYVGTTTKSTPSSNAPVLGNDHHHCYHGHSYYQDIFNNAEKENCYSSNAVFKKLYYLLSHDHACLSTLVRVMANLNLPSCQCYGDAISYRYPGSSSRYDHCIRDSVYRDAMDTYLTHQPREGSRTSVGCHSHHKMWEDLFRLQSTSSVYCSDDFIYHIKIAHDMHGSPACSPCHTTHNHVTSYPSHQHLSNAKKYTAYKKGECLSEHTVWSFLHLENEHHSGLNRNGLHIIQEMAALFPNGTDDTCVCTKNKDLHYVHVHYDSSGSCSHLSNYKGALSHLLDHINFVHSSPQTCHSHKAIWQELNQIAKQNYGSVCVEDLIRHLYASIQQQGDPCTCQAATTTSTTTTPQTTATTTTTQSTTTTTQSTTTTQPTTTTTQSTTTSTTATPSTTVKVITSTKKPLVSISTSPSATSTSSTSGQSTSCSKIRTITELAKFQQLYPQFNVDCSSHVSTSSIIVRDLCVSLPDSQQWKPGTRVIDACDNLKLYQPVATFSSSLYPVDGLAGIFVGCTSTSIKVATQECGGKFEIMELPRNTNHPESFTHTASNYYLITY